MDKIVIEMTTEQYKNVHLLLHNLIELTALSSNPVNQTVHDSLKNIKSALEK